MIQPLFLMDVLAGLGLGQQLMVAAVLVLGILYLLKAKKAGGLIVGVLSTAWLVAMSIAAVFVLVIVFNWADPNSGKFISDMTAAAQAIYQFVTNYAVDFVENTILRR